MEKRKGRGKNIHPNSLANLREFSPTNQPAGRGRRKGSRDRAKAIADLLDVAANPKSPAFKALMQNLEADEAAKKRTLQDLMILGQAISAINGNTPAFNALMDGRFGKLADKHELTGEDGAPIQTQTTRVILPTIPNDDDNSESRGTESD